MLRISKRADIYVIKSRNVGPIATASDERLAIRFVNQMNEALGLANVTQEEFILTYTQLSKVVDDATTIAEWEPSQVQMLNLINYLNDGLPKKPEAHNLSDDDIRCISAWCLGRKSR